MSDDQAGSDRDRERSDDYQGGGEGGHSQAGIGEVRFHKAGSGEVGSPEIGLCEVCPVEVFALERSASEIPAVVVGRSRHC